MTLEEILQREGPMTGTNTTRDHDTSSDESSESSESNA